MGVKTMYLHKDTRAQKMPHLLQDLFLKDIPCHCALQIKNKWITKPAEVIKATVHQFQIMLLAEDFKIHMLLRTCGLAAQRRLCCTPTGQSSQPAHYSYWDSEAG